MHWPPSRVLRLPGPKNALTQRQSKQRMSANPGRVVEKEPVLQAAVKLLTLEGLTVQVHELGQQVQEAELLDDDDDEALMSPDLGGALCGSVQQEPPQQPLNHDRRSLPGAVSVKQEKQEPGGGGRVRETGETGALRSGVKQESGAGSELRSGVKQEPGVAVKQEKREDVK